VVGTRINGVEIADTIKLGIKRRIDKMREHDVEPCLATILVGDDPSSLTYVKNKHKACDNVGILTEDYRFRGDVTQQDLEQVIDKLNSDALVHGILLQLPLPDHLNGFELTSRIAASKDVDGLTPQNIGLLAMQKPGLVPCTPLGIMTIFEYHKIDLAGRTVVVINRSNLIGKPLYHMLLQKNATVISCHSKTQDIARICLLADVIVTAVGNRSSFELRSDMIREGCAVIDAAITRLDGKLTGDTQYNDMIQKASFLTPVPGGVGPMTVTMLLSNTVKAAADIHNVRL